MSSDQDNHPATPEDTSDTSEYSLIVDEVADRFRAAGFPFSDRTASRWCQKGRIDCILVPVESGRIEKYFATSVSVDKEIERMQRLKYPVMTRHGTPWQDTTRHDAPHPANAEQQTSDYEERVKGLEQEKLNLTIDNKAKEQVINRLTEERREFIGQLTEQSRAIGRLETEMRALRPPAEDEPVPHATPLFTTERADDGHNNRDAPAGEPQPHDVESASDDDHPDSRREAGRG